MTDHYILDASNNELTVTNLFGSNNPTSTLGAIPLGTVGASATGELGVKVLVVGASGTGAGLTDTELRATPVPVSLPAGAVRTPTCTAAVASASTTAGVKSVTFVASSDFSGTVLGQTFLAGASLTFRADPADTLGAMAFTRTTGTLFIYYIP